MKTFTINCHTFGRKFSFNAKNENEAIQKADKWCDRHSFNFKREFTISEITEAVTNDLHNEYM